MKRVLIIILGFFASGIGSLASPAMAQENPVSAAEPPKYVVKPVAQKKIKQLPAGPLYWRVENFPTVAEAKTAVGPDGWNPASVSYETTTSLIAEVAGKVWVLTLGAKGGSTPGGSKVAEIGPVPPITASEYLLRVNYGSGPAGAKTPMHSHPGSEAFYVLTGRLGQKTLHGTSYAEAGMSMAQLAVAWTLAHPAITAPIVGASRADQLDDVLAAADKDVLGDLKARLDELTHEYRYGDDPR